MLQVLQSLALQLEQASPPTEVGSPLSSVVKQANLDSARSALLLQLGQGAASEDWLIGRRSSNLVSQSTHTYSYIGILSLRNQFNHSPPSRQASQTTLPPIIVISTLMSFIASGGDLVGSSLRSTMSASLPVVIEPLMPSS